MTPRASRSEIRNARQSYLDTGFNLSKSLCRGPSGWRRREFIAVLSGGPALRYRMLLSFRGGTNMSLSRAVVSVASIFLGVSAAVAQQPLGARLLPCSPSQI